MSVVEGGSVELSVGPSNGLREGVSTQRNDTIKMIPFMHGLKLFFLFFIGVEVEESFVDLKSLRSRYG